MATQVRLFVSAAPEEEPARELLGRALAELPVNVGWVIKRTPDVDSVAECHLFALVLGRDIVAPVGLELWWARRTEKPIIAYSAAVARTPAGQVFRQENGFLEWSGYSDFQGLRREFVKDILRFLLAHYERYGLTVTEAEAVRGYIAAQERPVSPGTEPGGVEGAEAQRALKKARGAGGGGVILAPGKDVPRGARVVGEE